MKRVIIKLFGCMIIASTAIAEPIEVSLDPGTFVVAYFNAPSHPELLTPIAKFTHQLERFAQEKATLKIDFQLGGDKPTLHLDRQMDRFEIYPCRQVFDLVNNKGFHFGEGAKVIRTTIRREGDTLIIVKKFRHPDNDRENELVVVSGSKEWIVKNVKVPETFMLWNWEFRDTFEYLDIVLRGR
jgi:hypothetical protein